MSCFRLVAKLSLVLLVLLAFFVFSTESILADCYGGIFCRTQTEVYRCSVSGASCNPDIFDPCVDGGTCELTTVNNDFTKACGPFMSSSCGVGNCGLDAVQVGGISCYTTPDCPPGTSYCAGCGSCMDTTNYTCSGWEAINCGLPTGETPPTGGTGTWGGCGSCSSCGYTSSECVLNPNGDCVWDYSRCHYSGPGCNVGSFYFSGSNDDFSNPCTDGGNDANCCAGYSCYSSWSQSGCGMHTDEFGNEYYSCDSQGWSGSCSCVPQCSPRCGQADQCGSTCSNVDASVPTITNILPTGTVYVDQTGSVTVTWDTTYGNTYWIRLYGSGGVGEDELIEAYVSTRSYTFTASKPHYDVSIQAINTTCSACGKTVPGAAATGSFDVVGRVTGRVVYDPNATAALSGTVCADADTAGFDPGGSSMVTGDDRAGMTVTVDVNDDGTYQADLPFSIPGSNLVTLNIGDSANYTCICPSGCVYPAADSPASNVNFYVVDATDPWFQVAGGPIVAYSTVGTVIQSLISPYCTLANGCVPALILNQNGADTEGYVLTGGGEVDTSYDAGLQADQIDENAHNWFGKLSDTPDHQDFAYFRQLVRLASNATSDFGATANQAEKPTQPPVNSGAEAYFHDGDLTINTASWDIASGESLVILVDGNVTISSPIQVANGGFLMIVASGNITIDGNLGFDDPTETAGIVEGVYVADGQFIVATLGAGVGDKRFNGEGTFVGWNGINLQRDYDDGSGRRIYNNTSPTEFFTYRPDLLVNAPDSIKRPRYSWRELNP